MAIGIYTDSVLRDAISDDDTARELLNTMKVASGGIGVLRNGAIIGSYNGATAAERGAALLLAKTAAVSGDTIMVGPGAYTVTANLLKNGVNWHFQDSVVTRTGTDAGSLFDDYTNGANGACTSVVSGSGTFIRDSDALDSDLSCVVLLTNSSSNLSIQALDLKDLGDFVTSQVRAVVRHAGGTLTIKCRDILGPNNQGVWWSNGPLYIDCNQIISRTLPIYLSARTDVISNGPGSFPGSPSNVWTDGYFWCRANLIQSTTADSTGLSCIGQNTDSDTATQAVRIWIDAQEIRGNDYSQTLKFVNYRNYIRALKISNSNPTSGFIIQQSAVKALVWLTAQKVEGGTGGGIDAVGGTGYYEIDDLNDAGIQAGANLVAVRVAATVSLRASTITKTETGRAISVPNGGTLNLLSGKITTLVGEYDLFQSGSGVLNVASDVSGSDTGGLFKSSGAFKFLGGCRAPSMTGTERDNLISPSAGTLIYNTTTNKLNVRVAAGWEAITSS